MKKTITISVALLCIFAVCACSVFAETELQNYPNSTGDGYINVVNTFNDYQVAFNTSNTINSLRDMVHGTDFYDFLYDQWYSTHYGSIGNTNDQLITVSNLETVSDYGCITICYDSYVNLGIFALQAQYHRLIRATLPFISSFPIDYVEVSLRRINETYGYTEDVFAYTGLFGWGTSVQRPDEFLRYDYTARPEISGINFSGDRIYPATFRICVDIYFTTDLNNNFHLLYNDVQLNEGSVIILNSNPQPTTGDDGTGGDDGTAPTFPQLPPEWNQDIYPRPTDPKIEEDRYYEDQLLPELDELTWRINALYQSIQGWIIDISDAFGAIVLLYDTLVLRMPLIGSLVEVSLYIGLCAFVLGSSAIYWITRRR